MARSKKTALEEQPNEVLDTGAELIQPEAEEPLFSQSEWDDSQSDDSPPHDFQSDLDPCGTEDAGWPDPQTDPELYQAKNTDESAPDTNPEAGEPDMPLDVPDNPSQAIPEPAEEPVDAAQDTDDSQPALTEEMPVEAPTPYAEDESLPETEDPPPSEPPLAQPKRLRMPRQRRDARVVSVIRVGIFIDLFGAETYIPLKELSYQRWVDAAAHYQPGQRVLVKVLEVDRSDRKQCRPLCPTHISGTWASITAEL